MSHTVNAAWQSALWATTLCQAGWLLWDQLDPPSRRLIAEIAQFEADRFLVPGYRVPYWNGKGGDTKAEENAWNSMVLQVAAAMMPRHAHAPGWRRVCSELMVSAYLLDVYAHVLGWDRDLGGAQARSWMRLRAEKLLARQLRHANRCVFTPEEIARTRYPGSEQEVAWLCADAFLLQWLRACGALGARGNWLNDPGQSP
jgi:hypothetical protein